LAEQLRKQNHQVEVSKTSSNLWFQ